MGKPRRNCFIASVIQALILRKIFKSYVSEKNNSVKGTDKQNKNQTHLGLSEYGRNKKSSRRNSFTDSSLTDDSICNFILKSALGFLGGILLTYTCFMFFVFSLNFTLKRATIICIGLGIILSLGLAFSVKIRCTVFLCIPQLFSKRGRQALLAYAFILALSGPAKNTLHNVEVMSESLACGQEQIKQAENELVNCVQKPNAVAKKVIEKLLEKINPAVKFYKHFILQLYRTCFDILETFFQGQKWLSSIILLCNEKVGNSNERCENLLNESIENCKCTCTSQNWEKLCNVDPNGVNRICSTEDDEICPNINDIYQVSIPKLKERLDGFKHRAINVLYVKVEGQQTHIQTNRSNTFHEEYQGMATEIRQKTDQFLQYFDFMSVIFGIFILVLFVKVVIYRHKFLTEDHYDNRFITRDFEDIDNTRGEFNMETVLPLTNRERTKYIKVASIRLIPCEKVRLLSSFIFLIFATFKIIIHMLTDSCLYWILSSVRRDERSLYMNALREDQSIMTARIMGKGMVAALLKNITDTIERHYSTLDLDPTPCLPDPVPPDFNRYYQITLVLICWLLALFEPYGLRLRHSVMVTYHPDRARERAIWLYNSIMRKRSVYVNTARKELRRKYKYPADDASSRLPSKSKSAECLLCKAKLTGDNFYKCPSPNCVGTYCNDCIDVLKYCSICKDVKEFEDLGRTSEEMDSSDEGTHTAKRTCKCSKKIERDVKKIKKCEKYYKQDYICLKIKKFYFFDEKKCGAKASHQVPPLRQAFKRLGKKFSLGIKRKAPSDQESSDWDFDSEISSSGNETEKKTEKVHAKEKKSVKKPKKEKVKAVKPEKHKAKTAKSDKKSKKGGKEGKKVEEAKARQLEENKKLLAKIESEKMKLQMPEVGRGKEPKDEKDKDKLQKDGNEDRRLVLYQKKEINADKVEWEDEKAKKRHKHLSETKQTEIERHKLEDKMDTRRTEIDRHKREDKHDKKRTELERHKMEDKHDKERVEIERHKMDDKHGKKRAEIERHKMEEDKSDPKSTEIEGHKMEDKHDTKRTEIPKLEYKREAEKTEMEKEKLEDKSEAEKTEMEEKWEHKSEAEKTQMKKEKFEEKGKVDKAEMENETLEGKREVEKPETEKEKSEGKSEAGKKIDLEKIKQEVQSKVKKIEAEKEKLKRGAKKIKILMQQHPEEKYEKYDSEGSKSSKSAKSKWHIDTIKEKYLSVPARNALKRVEKKTSISMFKKKHDKDNENLPLQSGSSEKHQSEGEKIQAEQDTSSKDEKNSTNKFKLLKKDLQKGIKFQLPKNLTNYNPIRKLLHEPPIQPIFGQLTDRPADQHNPLYHPMLQLHNPFQRQFHHKPQKPRRSSNDPTHGPKHDPQYKTHPHTDPHDPQYKTQPHTDPHDPQYKTQPHTDPHDPQTPVQKHPQHECLNPHPYSYDPVYGPKYDPQFKSRPHCDPLDSQFQTPFQKQHQHEGPNKHPYSYDPVYGPKYDPHFKSQQHCDSLDSQFQTPFQKQFQYEGQNQHPYSHDPEHGPKYDTPFKGHPHHEFQSQALQQEQPPQQPQIHTHLQHESKHPHDAKPEVKETLKGNDRVDKKEKLGNDSKQDKNAQTEEENEGSVRSLVMNVTEAIGYPLPLEKMIYMNYPELKDVDECNSPSRRSGLQHTECVDVPEGGGSECLLGFIKKPPSQCPIPDEDFICIEPQKSFTGIREAHTCTSECDCCCGMHSDENLSCSSQTHICRQSDSNLASISSSNLRRSPGFCSRDSEVPSRSSSIPVLDNSPNIRRTPGNINLEINKGVPEPKPYTLDCSKFRTNPDSYREFGLKAPHSPSFEPLDCSKYRRSPEPSRNVARETGGPSHSDLSKFERVSEMLRNIDYEKLERARKFEEKELRSPEYRPPYLYDSPSERSPRPCRYCDLSPPELRSSDSLDFINARSPGMRGYPNLESDYQSEPSSTPDYCRLHGHRLRERLPSLNRTSDSTFSRTRRKNMGQVTFAPEVSKSAGFHHASTDSSDDDYLLKPTKKFCTLSSVSEPDEDALDMEKFLTHSFGEKNPKGVNLLKANLAQTYKKNLLEERDTENEDYRDTSDIDDIEHTPETEIFLTDKEFEKLSHTLLKEKEKKEKGKPQLTWAPDLLSDLPSSSKPKDCHKKS